MPDSGQITVSVDHRDGITVISVEGDIDMATAPPLEAAVEQAVAEEPTGLVVDLSRVEFLGSVGLRILTTARHRLGAPARIAVVATNPATRRPFQLTGLDEAMSLPLYPTLDAAVAALTGAANDG